MKTHHYFFLFHWLKANVLEFERHASGATFKEITKGTFKKLPVILPPRELTAGFEALASPMMHLSHTLQLVNHNLRLTRDLLLPKLFSGEIDLERTAHNVDIEAKRVAAE